MNEDLMKFYEDFKGAIAILAQNLGIAAEHVYGVLVKQQVVIAWASLSVVMSLLLITLVFISITVVKDRKGKDIYEGWLQATVFFAALVVLAIAVTVDNIFTGFLNPEYGAIMEIKNMIK